MPPHNPRCLNILPKPQAEEDDCGPLDTPSNMCWEVERRRDRRFPHLRDMDPRPLLRRGHPTLILGPIDGKTIPSNDLDMVAFFTLCRGGRLHGRARGVRRWLEARLVDDLTQGEIIDRSPWPTVGFAATTMLPLGAVDALETWTNTVSENARRTGELLDIYHGFLPESIFFDTAIISRAFGNLMHADPHHAAGEILRHRRRELYDAALHAASASHDWPMVLETVRRLVRDRRAPAMREYLILLALRAWLGRGQFGEALRVAQGALVNPSCEPAKHALQTTLAQCHAGLGQWKRSLQAAEDVPDAHQPRAAYHRMIALLHLRKLPEAKTERERYTSHVGTDLYAESQFRSLARRLCGAKPPRAGA